MSEEMALLPTSGPIDLTTWLWGGDGNEDLDTGIAGLVMKGAAARVTEVLRAAFEDNPPRLSFPFEWGPEDDGRKGPAVSDPALMYVELPLGADGDDMCIYALSLEACVNDVIDGHQGDGKVESENGQRICITLAKRLRELAQKLEDACEVSA